MSFFSKLNFFATGKPSAKQFEKFSSDASKIAAEDHIKFLKKARRYVDADKVTSSGDKVLTETGTQRYKWGNATDNQIIHPLKYFKPSSLEEVVAIVKEAEKNHSRVKAVGSGHSFSDVGVTTDYLIDTHGLHTVLPLDASLLNEGCDIAHFFEVEAGMRISELNEQLFEKNLALVNMGGYDAQTIVGAASTSTHGSGISLGPLSSAIISVTIVASGGRVYRIEPADGITNAIAFDKKFPEIKLVQNDDWFNSVVVSMGCMGIIYSVILKVMDKYFLRECRYHSTWEEVKTALMKGDVLRNKRHYEVLVNPYKVNERQLCIVTERDICDEPESEPSMIRHRRFLYEVTGIFLHLDKILSLIMNTFPHAIPEFIDKSMMVLVKKEYINRSYRVLNLGAANNVLAYSSEIAFPMDTYISGIEKIFELAEKYRELGEQYHTSPISLRFVKASEQFLSMQHGSDTCMVEIPMINGTLGGMQTLERLERELYVFKGRPHWGQVNFINGANRKIHQLYPKFPIWEQVFHHLNPNRTFNNSFTGRCGFIN